jgi:hypothetical protein
MTQKQSDALLEVLKSGRAVTPLDALRNLGIGRLAARVHDLRALGFPIEQQMVSVGDGKKVAQYTLPSTHKSAQPRIRATEKPASDGKAPEYLCGVCHGRIVVRRVLLDPRYAQGHCPACKRVVVGFSR